MLNAFEPFSDLPRIDATDWIALADKKPPVGMEFEFIDSRKSDTIVRAMIRNVCETRCGFTFPTELVVTEENTVYCLGFDSTYADRIKWRPVGIIDQNDDRSREEIAEKNAVNPSA